MKKQKIEKGMSLVVYRNPESGKSSEVLDGMEFYETVKGSLEVKNGLVLEAMCEFISKVYIPTMDAQEVVMLDKDRERVFRVIKDRTQATFIRFRDIMKPHFLGEAMVEGWTTEKIGNDFMMGMMQERILIAPDSMDVVSTHQLPFDKELKAMAIKQIVEKKQKEHEQGSDDNPMEMLMELLSAMGGRK